MRTVAFAAFVAAAGLSAQSPSAEHTKLLADTFARYDRSGDGKVTRDEFPGSDAQFRAVDADGSGSFSLDEFTRSATGKALLAAFDASRKEPRPRASFDVLAARRLRAVLRLDPNRDGRVARAEWRGTDLAFRSLDLDGNGSLDTHDRKLAETATVAPAPSLRAFKQPLPAKDVLLAKLDRNKDGTLSPAELGGTDLAPFFAYIDSNGDGHLDGAELQRAVDAVAAAVYRRNAGTRADIQHLPDIPFATWDKDKDGRLANAEFELRNLFVAIDVDRDGYVTKEEIERFKRSIEEADFIARFDLNDDGRVSLAEFGGAPQVFRRADRNGDGFVSRQDF
ncbi:MAG: EF-hand domain-containing protein [Planctomycetota bacterium]